MASSNEVSGAGRETSIGEAELGTWEAESESREWLLS